MAGSGFARWLYDIITYPIHLFRRKSEQNGNNRSGRRKHVKCRGTAYPSGTNVMRVPVEDENVWWSVSYPEYRPVDYTDPVVVAKPVWSDPDYRTEATNHIPQWNALDGKVDRRSHDGKYEVVDGLPRNIVGRTGMCGRGCLGRWGPNHAADPIVTRWKRGENGDIIRHPETGKPVLQFVAIQRRDTGEWAIPGGMVDPGEHVSLTLKREFGEEALNSLEVSPDQKKKMEEDLETLFKTGLEVYRGYVDDPRNTDNSWMETVAYNFHDASGQSVGKFSLHAGDDAKGVQWIDVDSSLNLYASHIHLVGKTAKLLESHW